MGDLSAELLNYLNQKKPLAKFPGLTPVTSLDQIQDSVTLITVHNDSSLNLMQNIKIYCRENNKGVLLLNPENEFAENIRYSIRAGYIVSEKIQVSPAIPGLGLINNDYIKPGRAYLASKSI
jgi:hypothetical protein